MVASVSDPASSEPLAPPPETSAAPAAQDLLPPAASYEVSPGLEGQEELMGPPSAESSFTYDFGFVARGYYLNDQRIVWSGCEATFVAEGILTGMMQHQSAGGTARVEGEFYLNQPFDRNILTDTAERRSYLGNYDYNTFEISTLNVSYAKNDWRFEIGKMVTPFGRYYAPLFSNLRLDAPFIRTESILWRETGLLVRYHPEWFVADLAFTNGCHDLDTNSSKAILARIGLENDCFAVGCSVKGQDGIGSETQKIHNSHVGADVMFRRNRIVLSGEVVYDEYGLRHPLDANDLTWYHSIYYREQCTNGDPVHGLGYYVDLGYDAERYYVGLNYGEYYPEELGIPEHDVVNRRGLVRGLYRLTPQLHAYAVLLMETEGYVAQDGRNRLGRMLFTGLEYTF